MTQPATPAQADDLQTQTAQHLHQMMLTLADQCADMARMIHQEAKAAFAAAAPGTTPVTDRAGAFDRAARAVRRTAMLAQKFAEPIPVFDQARHRTAARQRIIRAVEDTIQREAPHGEAESLHEELLERLDSPDLDDAIDNRPVGEIITEICRDLGLETIPGIEAWLRRTPDDIALLCARAASTRRAATPSSAPPSAWPIPLPPHQAPSNDTASSHQPQHGRSCSTG